MTDKETSWPTSTINKHANPSLIKSKRVAVIGYGSQGHAHALNMQDSGVNVTVACYAGSPSAERAKRDGLPVATIEQATKNSGHDHDSHSG